MPRMAVNGTELFYDERGSGEPILLHHGYTGSHDVWLEEMAPRLQHRYRCIVMDCRGAGDSAHPESGFTIEQYARDVVGMADALGLDRFTYLGHSMGGGIGYQLALEYPERLERLILVAPIPSGGIEAGPEVLEQSRALREAPDGRERMLRQRMAMRVRASDESVERALDRALSVCDGHFLESWESMRAFKVTDRLGELQTPTLMIAGAADALAAANVRDWLRLPNATLHVFSRVGHSVPSDVPDEIAEVIADFMEHGVVNAATLQRRVQEATAAPAR